MATDGLTREEIAARLRALGVRAGDVLFVHSSLASLGHVAGGADAVVDACLDALGPDGTLVVPTFTPSHNKDARPVFDPVHDPSEVGRITETLRRRPGALRSRHLLHSVAALGPHAATITAVHGPSAFAADGPFWQVAELNSWILMLGVPYLRCTYFHVPEQLVQAFYRAWREVDAWVREPDGGERPLPTRVFYPTPGFPPDLNKFGALLEGKGLVEVGAIGNAIARLFRARDAIEQGIAAYRANPLILVKTTDEYTPLRDGVTAGELYNEKSVVDPTQMYPA